MRPSVLAPLPTREQRIEMNRTVIVQCINRQMVTTYARIRVNTRIVEVAFGNMDHGAFFIPSDQHVSVLRIADHPELGDLHDGNAWNLVDLVAFVSGLEAVEELELS